MAVAAVSRSERWLFGPLPDLLLGCGLLYAIVFAAHSFAGPALVGMTPPYLLPLLILLFSAPHYGGTLVRVYDQRHDRRAYVVFSVWITLAMVVLFWVTLDRPFLGSVLFTLYLTWSPWHYSGQNYGLAVMFLRRRGVEVTPSAKRWLYASFLLSFALAAIVSHLEVGSAYSPSEYQGQSITFLPIGITRGFGDVALPIVGAAYLGSVAASAYLLRRGARWSDLLPSFVLVLTQALWFAAPFAVRYWRWQTGLAPLDAQAAVGYYAVMIFLGHGIQYLWITTYYARAGGQWHGYANYWAKAVAAGLAIWTLPAILVHPFGLRGRPDLAVSMLTLIGTFVNLHHFVLDGAIWKLRNTRIASVLIRREPEPEADAAAPRSPWLRRLVWSTAAAAVVAGFAGFGLARFYAPAALARGDLAGAELGLDVGAWLGSEDPLLRVAIVEAMIDRGDKERAAALLQRVVVAYPAGTTYELLGRVEAMRGNSDAARAAFETALARNAPRSDRVHAALARLALGRGDESAASVHYRSALVLHPSATSIANDFAWLLATASDPGVRDAQTSVEVAEQLVETDGDPNHFDTLAAAYAAAGRFDDAIRAGSRAAALAEERRDGALLAGVRRNLERYRAGQTAAP